jgi:hypothetical protein
MNLWVPENIFVVHAPEEPEASRVSGNGAGLVSRKAFVETEFFWRSRIARADHEFGKRIYLDRIDRDDGIGGKHDVEAYFLNDAGRLAIISESVSNRRRRSTPNYSDIDTFKRPQDATDVIPINYDEKSCALDCDGSIGGLTSITERTIPETGNPFNINVAFSPRYWA